MNTYPTNFDRTLDFQKIFNREKVIKFLIKSESPLILDVGANNGSSIDEFKAYWPNSIIHCFEPQKECWDQLRARVNKFSSGKLVVNQFAVGSIPSGQATFFTHEISTGVSGFNRINLNSKDSIQLSKLKNRDDEIFTEYQTSLNHERLVEIIRLDNYLDKQSIDHVDLLKIDTQGFEPEVLDGLGHKLENIDVVISELMFYDYYERSLTFSDIEKYLLPAGFHLYDISHVSKNPMNGRTDWVDVIYVNNRLRV
jgi:FkbM family methyltransferase